MKESRNLEYKENINSNTFMKTVSAYANYGTGEIVFGITDDGRKTGVLNPVDACLNLENKINDSLKPVPDYKIEIREESLIVLTVYEGIYKPYLYKGKAYKRNDSSTIEVERLEYNRLILEGCNQSFEETVSIDQNLIFQQLEKKFIDTMGITKLNIDILKTLELYSDKNGFNNAAALLADKNSFKGIDIIRFGDSIDEIMDREFFDGISVISQLEKSTQMFWKYYQYEKIEGSERKIIDKVPEKAFREAIANALVHRMWDINAAIKVSMYSDRIEISSPGGLPAAISEEEYLNGQISILRNPIIGNVFFRLKYIEKFGTGILRINRAYANALIKPSYQIFSNSIKVILPVISTDYNLNETEKMLLTFLKNRNNLTRKEIEKLSGMEKTKIIRGLNNLIQKNIGQGTYYAYCHAWTRDENGKKVFGEWSNAYPFAVSAITPSQPVITSVKASGSTVTVTYTKASNADGYDVVLGTSTKKVNGEVRPVEYGKLVKKNVKGNVVTVTFKNVEKGTYVAGLHAYNRTSEDGKKVFSQWSNVKKVTVK